MIYITHTRFKDNSLSGKLNIPAKTPIEEYNGTLYYDSKPICFTTSENARLHFARNDDGNGMLRGSLIKNIQKRLAKKDENYQNRWDKIWEDMICQPLKREDYKDYWLWNQNFYTADISLLKHIAKLIDLKESDYSV